MWWLKQVFRASSRLANALAGGEGDTTFSAYSYELMVNHDGMAHYIGLWRVVAIDWLAKKLSGEENHCFEAWLWHGKHGLFQRDEDLG